MSDDSNTLTVQFVRTGEDVQELRVNRGASVSDVAMEAGVTNSGGERINFILNGARVDGAATLNENSRIVATPKVEGGC